MGIALPPAQFNLTVTFGSEEVIPVERLFKAFGLENLAIDPNQVLLPLKLPKDLPLEPTIEQFWQYRTGWEAPFDEEYDYRILLPEPAFSRVWEHCLKAFPTRIVSFSGPGRIVGVDLVIKPISLVDVTYRLWTQMHELDDTRLRIKALERSLEMITHNAAVLTERCSPRPWSRYTPIWWTRCTPTLRRVGSHHLRSTEPVDLVLDSWP